MSRGEYWQEGKFVIELIDMLNGRKKLLAEESGAYYGHGEISVALVYPNSYFAGMSNLGFQTIYSQLNTIPGVACERVFLSPRIVSLEKGRLLSDFELAAFSVSFELDYLNVLKVLGSAGIPIRSGERNENYPLIVAGGFAPSSNPEPLSMFVDAFLIGEGEEVISEFMHAYKGLRKKLNHRELLEELSQIRGVYVPGCSENAIVERRWISDLDDFDTVSRVLTPNTEFGNMFMIELSRGCPRKCRFCLAGSVCKPFRVRSAEKILNLASEGLKKREKIGLVSLEIGSYPYLDEVLDGILDMGGTVSLSSFRPGRWQGKILHTLKESGQKTIAIAPEAGSERLRRVIGKDIDEEEVMEQVKEAGSSGIKHIKLYFLVGLPGETGSDIEALIEFVGRVRKNAASVRKVTVSVNPFVPKPGTPFEWCAMEKGNVLSARLRMITKGLRKLPGVSVVHESVRWSLWQGLLARGDRRMGEVLELTYKMEGDWRKASRETGIDPEFYLRERGKDEVFPWDYLVQRIDKDSLYKEYRKSI